MLRSIFKSAEKLKECEIASPQITSHTFLAVLVPVVLIKNFARGMYANTRQQRAKTFPSEGVVDGSIEFLSPTMSLTQVESLKNS